MEVEANEKGFKGAGGGGQEALGGNWGGMRRASRELGAGGEDQEATGRHWEGSGGE